MRAGAVEIQRDDDEPREAERLHQLADEFLRLRLAFAQDKTFNVQGINNRIARGGQKIKFD